MKGFIPLFGTSTRVKFGGNAKLDIIHDFQPAGEPNAFITSSIPTGNPIAAQNTSLSARQSKFNVEFRSPTRLGDLRVFYENDFFDFNTGKTTFNLRHVYGQVWNVLAGFTYSTLLDPDAFPDTLDFEGPGSLVFVRQAQLRYTFGLFSGKRHTLAVAIENGTSDVVLNIPGRPGSGAVTPTAPWPDFVVRYRYEAPTWHAQLGAVFRSVGGYVTDPNVDKHVLGTGFSLAGSVQLFGKDYVLFQGNYGRGMGRYIQDTQGLAPDVAVESNGDISANAAAGFYVSYQRYWLQTLRSTAVGGYAWVDSVGKTLTTEFNRSWYAAANLIYNPRSTKFNIGIEYLWGQNQISTGAKGHANRVQISFQYEFVL